MRPLLSTPTPCSKSTLPYSIPSPPTRLPPTTYRRPHHHHHHPLISLFTHPDRLGTTLRTHRLTDSPTPTTFYPPPGQDPSKSKSHAANRRRHRQSGIANPARQAGHYLPIATPEQHSPAHLPVASQGDCLTHTLPQPPTTRIRTSTLLSLPSLLSRPAVYGARDSPRISISVYECAVRCRGRSSTTRISSWRGGFAQIGLPILQHRLGVSGRLHEQR